jgi:hypothetical protein
MAVGDKRAMIGRIGVALGFVCGVIGLLAGLTDHTWKLGPIGWFTGGILLTLVAGWALVDGAIAFRKTQLQK